MATVDQTSKRMAQKDQAGTMSLPMVCGAVPGKQSRPRMTGMQIDWRIILILPLAVAAKEPPADSMTARMEVTRSSRPRMTRTIHGVTADMGTGVLSSTDIM